MAIILGTNRQGEFLPGDQFNRRVLYATGNAGRIDGTSPLNPATTVRAGEFLMRNANAELILSDGTTVAGMALYDASSAPVGSEVDRPVVFTASGGTAQLTRSTGSAAVNVSNVALRSAVAGAGTLFAAAGTDYSIVTSTGVLTHVGGGAIVVGATSFASFDYALTVAEAQREVNYMGSTDFVTIMQSGFMPLLVGQFEIQTPRFEKGRTYTLNGAGSILYVNNAGLLTNNSSSAVRVGRVKGLPSAENPRLWAAIDIGGMA